MPRKRLTALVALVVLVLNIIVPAASVVASHGNGSASWLNNPANLCSVDKGPGQPASDDHHPGRIVCPLCVLLGGQVLAACPITVAFVPPPVRIAAERIPATPAAPAFPTARPQAARAPPLLA